MHRNNDCKCHLALVSGPIRKSTDREISDFTIFLMQNKKNYVMYKTSYYEQEIEGMLLMYSLVNFNLRVAE